jgi:hypothetical protein
MSFEHIADTLVKCARVAARARGLGDPTTESGHVRKFLLDGPKTTEQLEELTGLTGKQIWGRLKWDLQQGRIHRNNADQFEIVEVDTESLDAAIKLLRRNGYTVTRNKVRKAP